MRIGLGRESTCGRGSGPLVHAAAQMLQLSEFWGGGNGRDNVHLNKFGWQSVVGLWKAANKLG